MRLFPGLLLNNLPYMGGIVFHLLAPRPRKAQFSHKNKLADYNHHNLIALNIPDNRACPRRGTFHLNLELTALP